MEIEAARVRALKQQSNPETVETTEEDQEVTISKKKGDVVCSAVNTSCKNDMEKIVVGFFEQLIPDNTYITDLEETFITKGIIANHIDESQYKDITDEEAEIILARIRGNEEDNEEDNDNDKKEN